MTDTAPQAPAEPQTPPPATPTPAADVPEAPTPPPVAEPEKTKPPPVALVQARIDQITREKYEAKREAEAAKREVEELRRKLNPQQPAAPGSSQPVTPSVSPEDLDRLATERARQMAAANAFNEQCNKAYTTGKSELPDFDVAISNLKLLDGTPQYAMLLHAATSVPDAHKVLHHLGNNMDEAQRLMNLTPWQLGMELVRIQDKIKAKPVVSNAPPPVKPINGGGSDPVPGPDDNGQFKSQEEFNKWRAATRKKH